MDGAWGLWKNFADFKENFPLDCDKINPFDTFTHLAKLYTFFPLHWNADVKVGKSQSHDTTKWWWYFLRYFNCDTIAFMSNMKMIVNFFYILSELSQTHQHHYRSKSHRWRNDIFFIDIHNHNSRACHSNFMLPCHERQNSF